MPVPTPKNDKKGNQKGPNWGRLSKSLAFWILVVLVPVLLLQYTGGRTEAGADLRYDQYREQLDRGNIVEVTVQSGKMVSGTLRETIYDGKKTTTHFQTQLAAGDSPAEVDRLMAKNVKITSKDASPSAFGFILPWVPIILIVGFYVFMFRQMQAGGNKAFSFGKSKAKLLSGDTPKVTFADVAGADEAKVELQEII